MKKNVFLALQVKATQITYSVKELLTSDMHEKAITHSVQIRSLTCVLHNDFLRERGNSLKLWPGESVLPGEESPVLSLEPGEQPWIL